RLLRRGPMQHLRLAIRFGRTSISSTTSEARPITVWSPSGTRLTRQWTPRPGRFWSSTDARSTRTLWRTTEAGPRPPRMFLILRFLIFKCRKTITRAPSPWDTGSVTSRLRRSEMHCRTSVFAWVQLQILEFPPRTRLAVQNKLRWYLGPTLCESVAETSFELP